MLQTAGQKMIMTDYRKIMSDVISGNAAEFLPFAPRLEIWYRCNKIKGTLPQKYKNAELFDIIDDLDVGLNYMIPDFFQYGKVENTFSRGLGHLFSTVATAYNISFERIEMETEINGDLTICKYKTPYGTLQTGVVYNDTMRNSGITIPDKKERLIKSVDDYKAVKYLFENLVVVPQYEMYRQYEEQIGNRTIRNALSTQRINGVHLLMMDLMDYADFVYNQADYPEETKELTDVLDLFLEKCVQVSADSPADIITAGCHFDHILTGRPMFAEQFMPTLLKFSAYMEQRGKYLACHTDSDNENLLDLYVKSGIKVADSICTKPLTKQTYRDIRKETGSAITLFGVIPSIATMKNAMTDYEFESYLNRLLEEIQDDGGRNVILAIADTTPPDAEFDRIRLISELSRQVKPV